MEAASEPETLAGRDAVQWLARRRWAGPHLLDFAYSSVAEVFGLDQLVGALVPVDPQRGRRWDFFFEIKGDVASDEEWSRLVQVQLVMRERLSLTDDTRMEPARARFHVVLDPEPAHEATLGAAGAWLRR